MFNYRQSGEKWVEKQFEDKTDPQSLVETRRWEAKLQGMDIFVYTIPHFYSESEIIN